MELVLATRNPDKVREIRARLKDTGVTILTLEAFPEIPEVVEDGRTCEENAVKKARIVSEAAGKMALADDTGLEVDALQGQPGVHSARFAGENVTYAENCRELLTRMASVDDSRRSARFRCVMVLAHPDGTVRIVVGLVDGQITREEIGVHGFGYDPVFMISQLGRTMAQLTMEEKNAISHRGRALEQVRQILKDMQ